MIDETFCTAVVNHVLYTFRRCVQNFCLAGHPSTRIMQTRIPGVYKVDQPKAWTTGIRSNLNNGHQRRFEKTRRLAKVNISLVLKRK